MASIAGPITGPHPVEFCYGSIAHCYVHDVDEPWDETCYRACFECRHVFRSAGELLAGHNEHLAAYGGEPETGPERVFCCPLCTHDW